jgi:hypothetical protein
VAGRQTIKPHVIERSKILHHGTPESRIRATSWNALSPILMLPQSRRSLVTHIANLMGQTDRVSSSIRACTGKPDPMGHRLPLASGYPGAG